MEDDKQYVLDVIKQYRLFDDLMMQKCFDDKAAVQELLNVTLEEPFVVETVTVQFETKPNGWHGAIFDILALDRNGKQCDIEVQRADKGELVKRAEFYSGHLVTMALDTGESYEELRDTYVVFITETDIFKQGLPLYHIERYFRESGQPFGGNAHIVFVNGEWAKDDAVGRLMHDMKQTDASKIYNKVLAERMRIFTETEEGIKVMSELTEKIFNRGIERGIAQGMSQGMSQGIAQGIAQGMSQGIAQGMSQGIAQNRLANAKAFLAEHIPPETIARCTGLSLEDVLRLERE